MATDRFWALSVVSAVAACVLVGRPAQAVRPSTVAAGKYFYTQYCAKCHGPDGKGDGPAGKTMKPPPTNLTQLSKKNGGKFPFIEVLDILDGEVPYPAHGSAEMPAWGQTFQADVGTEPGAQAEVRGRLILITDYMRSIQQK
jgi:mono/diheme cytochrome c family protein